MEAVILLIVVAVIVHICIKKDRNHTGGKSGSTYTSLQRKYMEARNSSPAKNRIHGIPALGLVKKYGRNGEFGEKAEITTALQLIKLAERHPGVHILNNVQITPSWDIDHMVITENTVLTIDSKHWKDNTTYKASQNTKTRKIEILRDGVAFPGNTISSPRQIKVVKDKLKRVNAHSIVNMDTLNSKIENTDKYGFKLIQNKELLQVIDWLLYADSSKNKSSRSTTANVNAFLKQSK